ncbi:pentapeptide repeat-containing protein [Leptolyngbya sp. FACHB-261]|uniref:pentapeptide repeat-containing protein n=1 Tax=Leptolyngbya sp. FACHB-261 TaxID=2692806 RepID=UPI0016828147|nr:pentapeptide repeat-containing protein [Leptolyngbya sp. FACHB-261]MBD2099847.1 pentapeptide repeat-containing protein [Leptolyngbya sp. FACHB-261]
MAVAAVALGLMLAGLAFDNAWIGISSGSVALLLASRSLLPPLKNLWKSPTISPNQERLLAVAVLLLAVLGLGTFTGLNARFGAWVDTVNWDAFGALGQILIAILTLWVAWRQYVISKELTSQQNKITQQQTIDSYFQGISELVLDDEGQLEDWPQERAIAEGRTSAILSSVDADGKARILRFLSQSKLLTPLRRDALLGRAMLDGSGGYQEDRAYGVRVVDLGVMLAGADLTGVDLRWTDLSEANLIGANLFRCDLVRTQFYRTILINANFQGADLYRAVFFFGKADQATPRERELPPDYDTGISTGAIVENADFSNARRLSEEQRYYLCAWGGPQTRATIPGGCEGIPDKLER